MKKSQLTDCLIKIDEVLDLLDPRESSYYANIYFMLMQIHELIKGDLGNNRYEC